ncbi:MAG: hypothetical protein ACLP1X_12755 [Polyangiaceae bacterium]
MTERRSPSRRRRIGRRLTPAVAFAATVLHLACSSSSKTAPTPDAAGSTGTSTEGGAATASSSGAAESSTVAAGSLRDDGPPTCDAGAPPAGGATCPAAPPTSVTILATSFTSSGDIATYGSPPDAWIAYPAAGDGQPLPTLTPSAGAVTIAGTVQHSSAGDAWAAIGLSISQGCVDTTQLGGVQFSITGNFGGCTLEVVVVTPQDESATADPCRGECIGDGGPCTAPFVIIPESQFVDGMASITFNAVGGGSPSPIGSRKLIGLQWRFIAPEDSSAGCTPSVTLSGVMFYQ